MYDFRVGHGFGNGRPNIEIATMTTATRSADVCFDERYFVQSTTLTLRTHIVCTLPLLCSAVDVTAGAHDITRDDISLIVVYDNVRNKRKNY